MAYLRGQWNGWGALLGAAYSRYQIDDWRDVAFAGTPSSITADHRAQARAAFAQVGYDISVGQATLHPHVSASRHWLRSDGFGERGGAAALQVASAEDALTVVRAGLATRWDISGGQRDRAMLDATLAWERRSGDLRPVSVHQFAGSSGFAISGNAIARDAAVFDAGISISPTPRSRVRLGVSAGSDDAVARGASLTWAVSL